MKFLRGFCSSTALVVSYSFNFKSLGGGVHNYPWTDMSRLWSVASGVLCWGFPSAALSIGWGTLFNGLNFFTQNSSHMDCIWTILLHNLMISCGNWYFIVTSGDGRHDLLSFCIASSDWRHNCHSFHRALEVYLIHTVYALCIIVSTVQFSDPTYSKK